MSIQQQNLNVCQTRIDHMIAKASASATCPTCGTGFLLSGSGRHGEKVKLTGACPQHGQSWIYHTIR